MLDCVACLRSKRSESFNALLFASSALLLLHCRTLHSFLFSSLVISRYAFSPFLPSLLLSSSSLFTSHPLTTTDCSCTPALPCHPRVSGPHCRPLMRFRWELRARVRLRARRGISPLRGLLCNRSLVVVPSQLSLNLCGMRFLTSTSDGLSILFILHIACCEYAFDTCLRVAWLRDQVSVLVAV